MLINLDIKNLIIVQHLVLDFKSKMTILSGETGAGKSILIDALSLALGEKADKMKIRHGTDRAEISASFDINQQADVQRFLIEHQLESNQECILRRVLVRKGRARAYINNSPVTQALLRELSLLLVNIHGQHAHQSLLSHQHQRLLLDRWGKHQNTVKQVSGAFQQWQYHQKKLTQLINDEKEQKSRLDLLQFQQQELQQFSPKKDEYATLNQEQKQLASAEQLLDAAQSSIQYLYEGDHPAQQQIIQAMNQIQHLMDAYPAFKNTHELLNNALIQLEEANAELNQIQNDIVLDPQRLEQVDQRLSQLLGLAKKFYCEPDQLEDKLTQIEQQLYQIEHVDEQIQAQQQLVDETWQTYLKIAKKLTAKRQKSAQKLAKIITESMQHLSMVGGIFNIQLMRLETEKATVHGLDRVQFEVSTNLGQPLQAIEKVASGGELSRISLAIQVASAHCNQVPTLIFDEVDVGIGGGVAEIVGQLLRQLGETKQILCVTHLPQVAAQGHQHWMVKKSQDHDQITTTQIKPLNQSARIQELARMLGGVKITEQSLAHAKEMLVKSN